MEQVLKLAEDMLVKRVMSNHAPLTHTNKAMMALGVMIAALMVMGFGFMLAGLYIYLTATMPLFQALIIFGGVLILLSTVLVGLTCSIEKAKQKKIQDAQDSVKKDIIDFIKRIDTEMINSELIQNNPKSVVSLSALAGYLVAKIRL